MLLATESRNRLILSVLLVKAESNLTKSKNETNLTIAAKRQLETFWKADMVMVELN